MSLNINKIILYALFLATCSFSLNAQTVPGTFRTIKQDFLLNSNLDFGGYIYYNCSDVENKIESFLQNLGARDIHVRCYGGIDYFNQIFDRSASVSLQYSVLQPSDLDRNSGALHEGRWSVVKIQKYGDCYLLDQVFLKIKDNFTIRNYHSLNSCRRMNQKYQAELEILLPL